MKYCLKLLSHQLLSGRRELNSGYKTPSLVYYHYTTARLLQLTIFSNCLLVIGQALVFCRRKKLRLTTLAHPHKLMGPQDSPSIPTALPFNRCAIFLCRAAGNRTPSLRTRIVRTTGILRPVCLGSVAKRFGARTRI